jgi:hypothetical protein
VSWAEGEWEMTTSWRATTPFRPFRDGRACRLVDEESPVMNQHHRQFMQYLRAGGWVKVTALPPAPRVKVKLLALGWIERRGTGSDISYRITDLVLSALTTPVSLKK